MSSAAEILYCVEKALYHSETQLFPLIDLTTAYDSLNIKRFLSSKPISTLQKIFTDVKLTPRIGYNFSTSEISLTFQVSRDNIALTLKENEEKDEKAKQRAHIIWIMLGIHEEQSSIECEKQRKQTIANECVEFFGKQTGVAICSRKLDFQQQTIRVSICPFRETKNPNYEHQLYQYSPSYMRLTGYDMSSSLFQQQVLEEQRLLLILTMIDSFWLSIEKQNYLMNDFIKSELSNSMMDYFESAISLQTCQSSLFQPKQNTRNFNLYLYGTAGVGKSSFVKAFRTAFEHVLTTYVDPSQKVVIVKIPLNSLSPSHLLSILHVKGISDMSIERVIEQTLCKGHLVIFHLEENPEDAEIQRQLFENIQIMLHRLTDRYWEYRANILCFYTSNYEPIPMIVSSVQLLPITPPTFDNQLIWCERNLIEAISTHTLFQNIVINFVELPPFADDLRPLERWWRSIAFQVIKLLQFSDHSSSSIDLRHSNDNIIDFAQQIRVIINRSQKENNSIDHSSPSPSPHHHHHRNNLLISVFIDDKCFSEIELFVTDSLFCYSKNVITSSASASTSSDQSSLFTFNVDYDDEQKFKIEQSNYTCLTVVDMLIHNYIKPAIIVLVGKEEEKLRYLQHIRTYLHSLFTDDRLKETEVVLRDEKDKSKVFGEPGEILGGLFRFIDRVNNPNACEGRTDLFGLIISHVNEVGQFILRELIEADPSKTHRQTAHKERILFVMSIDEHCAIQPQLYSRAHTILYC